MTILCDETPVKILLKQKTNEVIQPFDIYIPTSKVRLYFIDEEQRNLVIRLDFFGEDLQPEPEPLLIIPETSYFSLKNDFTKETVEGTTTYLEKFMPKRRHIHAVKFLTYVA